MAVVKEEALVLRRTRFSETSLVVVLFTRTRGRIEALAKGCRRPKSPMRGHFDLFNLEEVVLYERSQGSLDILAESDIIKEVMAIRNDPLAFAAASMVGNLILSGCMPKDPHPRSFDACMSLFQSFRERKRIPEQLIRALLIILSDLGFQPELNTCASCGAKLPERHDIPLSGINGGFLCTECAPGGGGRVLSARAAASLRFLAQLAAENAQLSLQQEDIQKILKALTRYAEDMLGRELRSVSACVSLFRSEGKR